MFYIYSGPVLIDPEGFTSFPVRTTAMTHVRGDAFSYADERMTRLDPSAMWHPEHADGYSVCWVNDDGTHFVEIEMPA